MNMDVKLTNSGNIWVFTDLFFSIPELALIIGILVICVSYVTLIGFGFRVGLFPIFRPFVLITLFVYFYLGAYQLMFGGDIAYGFVYNSFFCMDKGVFVTKVVFSYLVFCITDSYLNSWSITTNSRKFPVADSKIFEFVLLILLMLFGMSVCLSSNNFVVFYLGLELQSFCIIILLFINAKTSMAVQSSITYFLSVLVSSVLFLVGVVYLYCRFG
jgi:NADH-quinone oxidoreductase subunit N